MERKIYEIIGKFTNDSNDKSVLGVDVVITEENFEKEALPKVRDNNYVYVFNIGRKSSVSVGEKYDIVFDRDMPRSYTMAECEVDYVSLRKNDKITTLPGGFGGCLGIKFKGVIPELVKKLRDDNECKTFIYFTTKATMEKILKKLDEAGM